MSEIRRYDTFNDVEFPSTDGPYYMVADADAKVSELEQQVKAARELLAEYRKRVTWAATSDSKLQILEDLRDQYDNAPAIGRFDNPTTYVRYLIERIAGQAAKLATLANELLAANMAWSNKCEENAALTAKLAESRAALKDAESRAALKDAESRALTPCPDCGWIAGERTVLLDMEDNSENAD